jgi:hypothetical protein
VTRGRTLAVLALVAALVGAVGSGLWRLGAERIDAVAVAAERQAWGDALAALDAPSALGPSVTALHDRGWVHWQTGDVPRAIAAWRAARALAPRDGDLAHDLALARSKLEHPLEPVPPAPSWTEVVTPAEAGLVATLLWIGASSLTLGWRRGRAPALQAGLATLVAAGASGFARQGRAVQRNRPTAVTVEDAVARDGAALDAGERFTIPPGSELRAVAVDGAFVLVEDATGRRGWVLADALEIPDPGALPVPR